MICDWQSNHIHVTSTVDNKPRWTNQNRNHSKLLNRCQARETMDPVSGAGKLQCSRCKARENVETVPCTGKLNATVVKRGGTCNWCQAREKCNK